jgi:hypothetical protein
MNEEDAIVFFRAHTIATARTLPLADAVSFLHGGLAIGGDHEALRGLREAYIRLNSVATRLEQLQNAAASVTAPSISHPLNSPLL